MLVLSRKESESLMIGADVEVFVVDITGNRVRLGVRAPEHVKVHRREVFDAIQKSLDDAVDR